MVIKLQEQLSSELVYMRTRRHFDCRCYLRAKIALLNSYMVQSGLKSIVIGISGGIDSALVLAIVTEAAKSPLSPINKVVAAQLPYFIESGTSNQAEATARGIEVAEHFGAESVLVDLSASHVALKSTVDCALEVSGSAWASGQLVSYLRTPALYYLTSLLTQQGYPALLLGSTNRDKGSYIGYFGKAADAMVDLQLISDLHKSEVYELSRFLGVPQSIVNSPPNGDIYDGRTDEELIQVPYDFIELYTGFLCLAEQEQSALVGRFGEDAFAQFEVFGSRLRRLNSQNKHKYLSGSSALHLDVYPRAVPGGWRLENPTLKSVIAPDINKFVNPFELDSSVLRAFEESEPAEETSTAEKGARANSSCVRLRSSLPGFGDCAFVLENLLSSSESEAIVSALSLQNWVSVGQNGKLKDFDANRNPPGSLRASSFCEELADILWERISPLMPTVRVIDGLASSTSYGPAASSVWRAVGVNPLMRFIRYQQGGLLVPHYDAPYEYSADRQTLMSVVVYLTNAEPGDGGATRFLIDSGRHIASAQRDFADWTRPAFPSEVLCSVSPQSGAALVFDHRILHDSALLCGRKDKIIIRTDIIFERCGLPNSVQLGTSRPLGLPEVRSKAEPILSSDLSASPKDICLGNPMESSASANQEQLLAKALSDPFYAGLYELCPSFDALEDAGFFDDGGGICEKGAQHADENWLMTPLYKIQSRLAACSDEAIEQAGSLVVLFTTGGFCPVHDGHLRMMELAKTELEGRGDLVLGGYFCPDHDFYLAKKCPERAISALDRLRRCEIAVRDSNWLMVDPWAALGAERALNFTEILMRLERYLSSHVRTHRKIEVCFVLGGDNARLTKTFLRRGRCVCVRRPGYDYQFEKFRSDPLVAENKQIVFVSGSSLRLSSSELIGENRSCVGLDRSFGISTEPVYLIRDEGDWVLEPWLSGRVKSELVAAWSRFKEDLRKLIAWSHLDCDYPVHVQFEVLELEKQLLQAKVLTDGESVISLDPLIAGNCNLAVSRHFAMASALGAAAIAQRPGHPELAHQLSSIPPGRYVLFDDDIDSGFTIGQVRALLPAAVKISRLCALSHREDFANRNLLDILDCRDFLAGSREGGLVLAAPDGSLVRSPYALPYVWTSARVSTPVSKDLVMAREIWRLNLQFFEAISSPLRLSDMDGSFRSLMHYLHFTDDTAMTEICLWHLRRSVVERGGLVHLHYSND